MDDGLESETELARREVMREDLSSISNCHITDMKMKTKLNIQ